jgi:hypothetical protein
MGMVELSLLLHRELRIALPLMVTFSTPELMEFPKQLTTIRMRLGMSIYMDQPISAMFLNKLPLWLNQSTYLNSIKNSTSF